jgi:dihydroorotate dehydrogenase electron transfer subunit
MIQKHLLQIKNNQMIADRIFRMDLSGNFPHSDFLPGKFLHVKCGSAMDTLLRRPMSILDVSDDEKTLSILYRVEGNGTELLSKAKTGTLIDVLAPLGQAFPLDKAGPTVLLVGGGIGVPPLYYLGRKLKARGMIIKSILGFNSQKDSFLERDFAELGESLISTVDGSYGHHGLVTDLLAQSMDWDILYCCGPNAMMRAIQKIVPDDKEAYMSIEERMGCGVGACLACVCEYADDTLGSSHSGATGVYSSVNEDSEMCKSYKRQARVCTEGPVFALHEIKL